MHMENEIMRNWLLMLALVFGATNANAELVLKDFLPGSGDKMIMYDTSTKLEWLRLTATAGMSFDDVRKSRWIHLYGFRIATYPEFQSLFTNFGLAEQQSQDYQQVSHALHLATLLGPTIYGDGRISAYGMTATNFISGSYIPPIGMEFTPVTGKVDLLVGIDTGSGLFNIGAAHGSESQIPSTERNQYFATFLIRKCRPLAGNTCR